MVTNSNKEPQSNALLRITLPALAGLRPWSLDEDGKVNGVHTSRGAGAVRDIWYGDNRDLVKWGVLLKLANLHGASRIVQVAYYRPETIEIDGVGYPMPDAVMAHFSRSVMDIVRLNVGDSPSVQINLVNSPLSSRDAYMRKVLEQLAALSVSPDSPCIIFLDPDTGLEPPKAKPGLQHVLESELTEIWNVMRGNDVLVFYQHGPLVAKGASWIEPKQRQFECALGLSKGAAKMARGKVATDVVFFFAQKSPATDRTKTVQNVCPECDHKFKGNGFDGIDAHWRARHEHIMPYKEAWLLIKSGGWRRHRLLMSASSRSW